MKKQQFEIVVTGSNIYWTGRKVTGSHNGTGIKFRSGNFFKDLGDTLIYNDFDLHVTITARAVAVPALA